MALAKGKIPMKRCTKCVLPETFPGIYFNEAGICNYCLSWQPVKVFGRKELETMLEQCRGKGREYDILVPLSGGRDSTYVLHQIVKKYKMRAIALTVDSGFILPEGVQNIENCTKVLNVPHVWLKNEKKIGIATKNANTKFQGWLNNPSINTIVPVLNSGDKTMNLQMHQYAHDQGIPIVMGGNIVGNSSFEQENWKTGFMGIFPNARGVYTNADKLKLMFKFAGEFLSNSYNFKWSILSEYITGIFGYFFESMLKPKDTVSIGFYDYVLWNEKEVVTTVVNECGWKGTADSSTTWRIGDSAYPVINYIYFNLVGFTEHDEHYSRLIRENQLSREEALKRLENDHKSAWIFGARLEGLLKDMGVEKEQLDKALGVYNKKLMHRLDRR